MRPPPRTAADPAEVHLWFVDLDAAPAGTVRRYRGWLPDQERMQAGRSRTDRDERRAVVARAVRRKILAAYLPEDAPRLRFGSGPKGKPHLQDASDGSPGTLRFNVAHSEDIMLLAVMDGEEVGVDIERVQEIPNLSWHLDRCLTPNERQAFREIFPDWTDGRRLPAFYKIWTRKEAWLKAAGLGLSGGLTNVAVSASPDDSPRLLALAGEPASHGPASEWWLRDLDPGPGWAAALAGHGSLGGRVVWKRWGYGLPSRPQRLSSGESASRSRFRE